MTPAGPLKAPCSHDELLQAVTLALLAAVILVILNLLVPPPPPTCWLPPRAPTRGIYADCWTYEEVVL